MAPLRDGTLVTYVKKGYHFKSNYARLGPFLTAFVRKQMITAILPIKEHVFRCHTDSILADQKITHLKLGTELGQWKVEHEGACTIHNGCKVVWHE
jgi:hypothetical protein